MTAWRLLELEPVRAAAGSLPGRILAPADAPEIESGEFNREIVAGWSARFLREHPEDPMAAELAPLVRKEPLWQQVAAPLQEERWEDALGLLDQIIAVDPSDAAARFNRASALRGVGRGEESLAEFRGIEGPFADEALYHVNVGLTLEELGRPDDAASAYGRALELAPADAFVLDRLVAVGRLVFVRGPDGEGLYVEAEEFAEAVRGDLAQHAGEPDYLADVATAMLEAGQDDLARNAAELALAADPSHPAAQLFASVAYARLGRLEDALRHVDRHVQGTPSSAAGHLHRAHVLHALDRGGEAREAAERALELDPNALPAAQIAVAGDDGPGAARERARALAERHPRAWAPLHVGGDLALSAGDEEGAMGLYERAVELGADDLAVRSLLGELGRRGRIDDLCEIADRLPGLATRDAGLRWNVAAGYEEAGRTGEARIVFASIAHDEQVPPDLRAAAEERVAAL